MSKNKVPSGTIGLQIPAKKANPAPPIGPALGQKGLNIAEFCKQFNEATKAMEEGMPIPVVITYYADRTFTFITKTPPASYLVLKAVQKQFPAVKKGSGTTGKDPIAKISREELFEIAKIKIVDMNASTLESAVNSLAGTALSMGIEVTE